MLESTVKCYKSATKNARNRLFKIVMVNKRIDVDVRRYTYVARFFFFFYNIL